MPLGGLITLAILLPNLLVLVLPPREAPPSSPKTPRLRQFEIIERIGQAGVLLIPFFTRVPALRDANVDALVVMALALFFYYSAWARYVFKGHRHVLLYAPFLGIPLPMAISPLVYFGAAAVFLESWPLAAATALLAVGHLAVSNEAWKRSAPEADLPLAQQRRG